VSDGTEAGTVAFPIPNLETPLPSQFTYLNRKVFFEAADTTYNSELWKASLTTHITLTKHLVPASDPGRFDLKVGSTVVKAGAGDGDSGSKTVNPGTYTIKEVAAAGTTLSNYNGSIACTRNGHSGPTVNGKSMSVTVGAGDELACTFTNVRK
jgi:hypothetical protein